MANVRGKGKGNEVCIWNREKTVKKREYAAMGVHGGSTKPTWGRKRLSSVHGLGQSGSRTRWTSVLGWYNMGGPVEDAAWPPRVGMSPRL